MRSMLIFAGVISMFFASGLQASPFSTPPTTTPPFEDLPPQPDVPPEGSPPFDLGFEIPVGPPSGVGDGRPVGLWMMTLPVTATGLDLDVPMGPPSNLPPVMAPPDFDHPPFTEFPPDFEPPPFFANLPPGINVRPVYASSSAGGVFAGGVVPEPATGLLLGIGLTGLAWVGRKRRATSN